MLTLRWLGHSTVVLDLTGPPGAGAGAAGSGPAGAVRLLTDPLLGRHAWPLRRRGPGPDPEHWAHPDAVLLSHLHHDHAQLSSLRPLKVPVLTAPASAQWLQRKGVDGRPLDPAGGRQAVAAGGWVGVRLVEADHHHRPMPHRPNDAHGYLIDAPGLVVWFAGDTALMPSFATLAERAGAPVDVAVVPVSGWGPRLSAGHLDPEQAAEACALVGARAAVPVHWGTLHAPAGRHLPRGWMTTPGAHFVRALRRVAPRCEPVLLRPGQAHVFG